MSKPQVVLVTGGNSGLGRTTAETLARRGHIVFAGVRESAGRNAAASDELRTLADAEGVDLRVVDLDVNDDASVERAVRELTEAEGRVDVAVNNAGIAYLGPTEAFTVDQARRLFETNVFGVLRVNRAVLPHMRAQGSGLLVHMSSVVGRLAMPFAGLYASTKFALEGLAEAYRQELAPQGIDAVMVEPGAYPTPIWNKGVEPEDGARVSPYEEQLALANAGIRVALAPNGAGAPDPYEVAEAVARLIETPANRRPFRTVVAPEGQRQALQQINEVSEHVMRAMLEARAAATGSAR